jgi:flavin reductase (DIM6/NTAB) family NADH-FMN oxidoreductase RutF
MVAVPSVAEPRAFRDVLGLFATGIAVMVAEVGAQVHAMTANAVSSVSLDPMLILFCPGKRSRMAAHVHELTHFSINFLRSEQQAQSTYFAGGWKEDVAPAFRFVPWAGAPRLEGSLASLGCEKERVIDAGDHWIVIGRVIALHRGIEPLQPLLFFRGNYRHVDFADGAPAPDLSAANEPPHIFYDRWHS